MSLLTSPSFLFSVSFLLLILFLSFHTQHVVPVTKPSLDEPFPGSCNDTFETHYKARKLESTDVVVIRGTVTLLSVNRTFELGWRWVGSRCNNEGKVGVLMDVGFENGNGEGA
ncbi:hypothetical protein V6N12_002810 [Hibiscus sabdariffa]|uniref:Uncharacterized protein n=1 Tax=Hibiscus sabdariffa TaxID=183260 RepID=A0ABR2EAG1_9ROSI